MQRPRTPHRVLVVDLIARAVGGLQKRALRGIEREAECFYRDLELRSLRRAHNRDIRIGVARNPGHPDVGGGDSPSRGHLTHPARDLHVDACDHIFGLRNIDVVPFYDVGNVYTYDHSVGPTAHAVGTSFRFDVSWFSFVERTLLRFDIAKTLNVTSATQFWFGVGVPF